MHSFHHSRGRIIFEVFCALTIAASCAVAWLQTGAPALLAIAAVTALYSVVHATDVGRRAQVVVTENPKVERVAEGRGDLLAYPEGVEEKLVVEEEPKVLPQPKRRSRKKPPASKVVSVGPAADLPEDEPTPEIATTELTMVEIGEDVPEPEELEEEHQSPIAPLFEPEPFARQQRTVFGRKAG